MWRYDEAEALMQEGRKRFPRQPHFAEGLAQVALRRGDARSDTPLPAGADRKFPMRVRAYSLEAACLNDLDRTKEAEALLLRALRFAPGDIALNFEYAKSAARRKDWEEALRRWTAVREKFRHIAGPIEVAKCLKELGRYDEADALLRETFYSFPLNKGYGANWRRSPSISMTGRKRPAAGTRCVTDFLCIWPSK